MITTVHMERAFDIIHSRIFYRVGKITKRCPFWDYIMRHFHSPLLEWLLCTKCCAEGTSSWDPLCLTAALCSRSYCGPHFTDAYQTVCFPTLRDVALSSSSLPEKQEPQLCHRPWAQLVCWCVLEAPGAHHSHSVCRDTQVSKNQPGCLLKDWETLAIPRVLSSQESGSRQNVNSILYSSPLPSWRGSSVCVFSWWMSQLETEELTEPWWTIRKNWNWWLPCSGSQASPCIHALGRDPSKLWAPLVEMPVPGYSILFRETLYSLPALTGWSLLLSGFQTYTSLLQRPGFKSQL